MYIVIQLNQAGQHIHHLDDLFLKKDTKINWET